MPAFLLKCCLFGFLLTFFQTGIVSADAKKPLSDIVYSARYYKPGTRPSHYKIWRIDSTGSKLIQVTSGTADDHSPVWLADGRRILFVRERGKTRALCTVDERGGPVTTLAVLHERFVFIDSVAPDRKSVVYNAYHSESKLFLIDVVRRKQQELGAGHHTAWSPDSRRLYISPWGEPKQSSQILDLSTGNGVSLADDLRAAAWVDDNTLVAEVFSKEAESARLVILNADGTRKGEILLPFAWNDKNAEFSPFADNMFAVPSDPDSILYGRHAGNSTEGAIQMFYRVNLKGGAPTTLVEGRDLAWSPDHKFFITGAGRRLAPLDRKRQVWVSPLSIVSPSEGKAHPLVRGLVSVEGFDWRPQLRESKR